MVGAICGGGKWTRDAEAGVLYRSLATLPDLSGAGGRSKQRPYEFSLARSFGLAAAGGASPAPTRELSAAASISRRA
jgi:hypothetical protein